MNITIADELLHGIELSADAARVDFAVGLLTEGKITRQRAARIAGLDDLTFIRELQRRQIRVVFDTDDLADDLRTLEQLRNK